jgi:hypothetical protein
VATIPATTSTGPVRDQWAKDQQDKAAELPPPSTVIRPLPQLATPMIESPEEARVAYRAPAPVAPPTAPPPAAPRPTQLTTPMVESPQELAVVNRTPTPRTPVRTPAPLPRITNRAL